MKWNTFLTALLIALLALSPSLAVLGQEAAVIVAVDSLEGSAVQEETVQEGEDEQAGTMYTKKEIKLFKAKKTSSKVLDRIPKGEDVAVLEYGKTWSLVRYLDNEGYVKSANLTDQAPQPDVPADPGKRQPSVPASRAATHYTKSEASILVPAAQIIAALAVDYHGLEEGYFSRIYSAVSANIDSLLSPVPQIPSSLAEYEQVISAACADLANGATFELLGKQLNNKKAKTTTIFSVSDSVIGLGSAQVDEAGEWTLDFGQYTVKNVSKGTYYMQIRLVLDSAPHLKGLYGQAQSITCLYPIKVAKLSTGSTGGSSGGTKQQPVARLIVDSVRTEPELPSAGDTFDVILTLRNTSETLALRNLQLTYTSEDDSLAPVSGTNTEYIERIEADSNYNLRLNVKAKPDMEVSSAKLDISVDFEDSKFNALSSSQTLVIPVKQVQRIQLDEPKLPTTTTIAGDSYEMEMGVFNMGMTMLYNVTVKAVPQDAEKVVAGQSYYIGNMEPGTSKTAELELIPLEGGYFAANIEVTYETVDGQQSSLLTPISFSVEEEEVYDYTDDFNDYSYTEPVAPQPPTALEVMAMLPWQIYVLAGLLVLTVILWMGAALHRRRLRALEDDEMD